MRTHWCKWTLALALVAASGAEEMIVLPNRIDGGPPQEMVRRYLLQEVDEAWERWQADYETRTTPEAVAAYQRQLREQVIERLGGFPERTPLNPQVTGTIERDGYQVEKVIYESRPHHFVTAALFLPDPGRHAPPYPGILVPCGHTKNAKAHDEYQSVGALLALNGMAALVFDPIDQGERGQLLGDDGKPVIWGTTAHSMLGVGSILLGTNTAAFEIWDGMRGIDYLESRPEVDPGRIGCTGNSGGGTQTSYLMALDGRIDVAAPSCYINHQSRQLRTATGDAEQNVFGQLAFGFDHPDYILLRAPKPTLILAATEDFFDIRATWETFRFAKRLYTRMEYAERVDLLENDAEHNYNKTQREGAVRWMARWLLGRDEPIVEPALELIDEEDLWCTPNGEVMLLEDARSVYDINIDRENELAKQRHELWTSQDPQKLLARVRDLAGIRTLDELGPPEVQDKGKESRKGYRIRKLILTPEKGIHLPALLFTPKNRASGNATLYVHEDGKSADAGVDGPIETIVRSGQAVLAVDLRAIGETGQAGQKKFGATIGLNWEDVTVAYALGRSYVGMRAEDVLACTRYLAGEGYTVDLLAIGNTGVPALHAAALEPGLFKTVTLRRTLESWSNVIRTKHTRNQYVNTVHGALEVYDLPDLAATLGDILTVIDPVNALGTSPP